jgi:hypothetical protein
MGQQTKVLFEHYRADRHISEVFGGPPFCGSSVIKYKSFFFDSIRDNSSLQDSFRHDVTEDSNLQKSQPEACSTRRRPPWISFNLGYHIMTMFLVHSTQQFQSLMRLFGLISPRWREQVVQESERKLRHSR